MQQIVNLLSQLDYDQLVDWIDFTEYVAVYTDKHDSTARYWIRLRRRGKTALEKIALSSPGDEALRLVRDDKTMAENAVAVARSLARALEPRVARKGGRGNIQIKYRFVPLFDLNGQPILDAQGNQEIKVFGPYMYLRIWATGGDLDRQKKRVKSIYIGGELQTTPDKIRGGYPYRDLAGLFDSLYEIRDGRRHRTPALIELEARIMACINTQVHPPVIDYAALDALQAELLADGE